ncbi:hypothetical protein BC332_19381 [Capsicum chinense]|nr:hypothetical protein BC332_19381 [Capsicum chinense]
MTMMRGIPGYLALEWLSVVITGNIDVYSFGIVILETLSGRRHFEASETETEEERTMLNLFRKKEQEGFKLEKRDHSEPNTSKDFKATFFEIASRLWNLSISFVLVTLRWYHGGEIEFDLPPEYIEIKCDKVICDIVSKLKNENELKVYVSHGVSEPDQAPLELEYVPNISDNRVSKRHFNKSQRRSRDTTNEQINVGEKGPDIGYDDTNDGTTNSLVSKPTGDEPYYLSDEAPSFKLDDEIGRGDGEEVDGVVQQLPRLSSRRVISTGAKVTKRFGIGTGGIGYTPRQGFK